MRIPIPAMPIKAAKLVNEGKELFTIQRGASGSGSPSLAKIRLPPLSSLFVDSPGNRDLLRFLFLTCENGTQRQRDQW